MNKQLITAALVAVAGVVGGFVLDNFHVYGYAGAYGVVVAMAVLAAWQLTGKKAQKH